MKTKIYRSTIKLSESEFLKRSGLNEADVKKILRSDYFDASMDNLMAYLYSFYEVTFN